MYYGVKKFIFVYSIVHTEASVVRTRQEFNVFYQKNADYIHNFVRKRISRQQDIEDIVQETFMKAWRARSSFELQSRSRTWLARIARNACTDFYRRKTAKPIMPLDHDPVGSRNVVRVVESRELVDLIVNRARNMGDAQYALICMRYEGHSAAVIDRTLGIHRNTHYNWLKSLRRYAKSLN
jgi:RNA polymerase sigma factor (sigma-70 family)